MCSLYFHPLHYSDPTSHIQHPHCFVFVLILSNSFSPLFPPLFLLFLFSSFSLYSLLPSSPNFSFFTPPLSPNPLFFLFCVLLCHWLRFTWNQLSEVLMEDSGQRIRTNFFSLVCLLFSPQLHFCVCVSTHFFSSTRIIDTHDWMFHVSIIMQGLVEGIHCRCYEWMRRPISEVLDLFRVAEGLKIPFHFEVRSTSRMASPHPSGWSGWFKNQSERALRLFLFSLDEERVQEKANIMRKEFPHLHGTPIKQSLRSMSSPSFKYDTHSP
jgi:hypothetical protein